MSFFCCWSALQYTQNPFPHRYTQNPFSFDFRSVQYVSWHFTLVWKIVIFCVFLSPPIIVNRDFRWNFSFYQTLHRVTYFFLLLFERSMKNRRFFYCWNELYRFSFNQIFWNIFRRMSVAITIQIARWVCLCPKYHWNAKTVKYLLAIIWNAYFCRKNSNNINFQIGSDCLIIFFFKMKWCERNEELKYSSHCSMVFSLSCDLLVKHRLDNCVHNRTCQILTRQIN